MGLKPQLVSIGSAVGAALVWRMMGHSQVEGRAPTRHHEASSGQFARRRTMMGQPCRAPLLAPLPLPRSLPNSAEVGLTRRRCQQTLQLWKRCGLLLPLPSQASLVVWLAQRGLLVGLRHRAKHLSNFLPALRSSLRLEVNSFPAASFPASFQTCSQRQTIRSQVANGPYSLGQCCAAIGHALVVEITFSRRTIAVASVIHQDRPIAPSLLFAHTDDA